MSDLKLHKILDSMNVPREVWIGTDSVADRLEWLKRRKEMLERESNAYQREKYARRQSVTEARP